MRKTIILVLLLMFVCGAAAAAELDQSKNPFILLSKNNDTAYFLIKSSVKFIIPSKDSDKLISLDFWYREEFRTDKGINEYKQRLKENGRYSPAFDTPFYAIYHCSIDFSQRKFAFIEHYEYSKETGEIIGELHAKNPIYHSIIPNSIVGKWYDVVTTYAKENLSETAMPL